MHREVRRQLELKWQGQQLEGQAAGGDLWDRPEEAQATMQVCACACACACACGWSFPGCAAVLKL